MKLKADQLKKKYDKANAIKMSWDNKYQEVFDIAMPARDSFESTDVGGKVSQDYQDKRENLYTSVPEQSAIEFVNTMQEILCPPMSKWISLVAGMNFKDEERDKVNEELEKITDIANEYKNNSSFDTAISEFFYDLFAGTACMLTLPGSPARPISYKAIPIKQYCIEEGVDGEVRGVFRKFTMQRGLLGAQWAELKGVRLDEESAEKEVSLIESTYFDYDQEVYHYQVMDEKETTILVEREYQTNPFTVLRWNKCAGEAYGRGVGITSLNDSRTLNLIMLYSLRAFAYQLPIILAQEDAMLDVETFDQTPLTLNIVPDVKGIETLNVSPNYSAESYKVEELIMQIKKNTYSSTLPPDSSTQTATEIRQKISELRKSLNSVAGRLVSEGVIPLVRRTIDVLGDTGVLGQDFPERFNVQNINGLMFKVNLITPLGKIIRYNESQAMKAGMGTLVELDPTGQTLEEYVKTEEAIPNMLELESMPMKFIRTKDEVLAKRQERSEQMAQAQQSEAQMDIEVSNEKEIGKAAAKGVSGG